MTDEQIIKALKCCMKDDCDNCPNGFGNCEHNLAEASLDLINRQKAEIERLRNIVKADLLTAKEDFKLSLSDITKIRAEAIKEFAERLIDIAVGNWKSEIDVATIEQVKNEMVGEDTNVPAK